MPDADPILTAIHKSLDTLAESRPVRAEAIRQRVVELRVALAPTRVEQTIILQALEEREERLSDGPPATLCHPDEEYVLPALIRRLRP